MHHTMKNTDMYVLDIFAFFQEICIFL